MNIKDNQKEQYEHGKHYVISDIHGQLGSLLTAMKTINENDTLYILGDVIDRSPYSMEVLKYVMGICNKKIKFILGNHEWSYIKCYEIAKKYNLSFFEIKYLISKYSVMEKYFHVNIIQYMKSVKYVKSFFNGIIDMKRVEELWSKIPEKDIQSLFIWMHYNGAEKTVQAWDCMTEEEKEEVYNFLLNANIMCLAKVEGKKYCLTHAAPYDNRDFVESLKSKERNFYIKYQNVKDIMPEILEYFMYKCTCLRASKMKLDEYTPFDTYAEMGYQTIYGHDAVGEEAVIDEKRNSICIDVRGGVALYCIETGMVRYISKAYAPTDIAYISEPHELKVREIDNNETDLEM